MNPVHLSLFKRAFALGAAAPILLAYLVTVILGGATFPEALLVLVAFLPLFLPSAVYFFWVTHPASVIVCGVILVALTAPPWLLVCSGDVQHFSGGALFLATMVAVTIGASVSKTTSPVL